MSVLKRSLRLQSQVPSWEEDILVQGLPLTHFLCALCRQVNNATARVMTNKKAANPYTNGNGVKLWQEGVLGQSWSLLEDWQAFKKKMLSVGLGGLCQGEEPDFVVHPGVQMTKLALVC